MLLSMKNVLQKLTFLSIAFMAVGCAGLPEAGGSASNAGSTSRGPSSSMPHVHSWKQTWDYDGNNHWHSCNSSTCDEKNDVGAHQFGDWQTVSAASLSGNDRYKYVYPKVKTCSTCGYKLVEGTNILPELRFNFSDKDSAGKAQVVDFMNIATKTDKTRPEVEGIYSLSNCQDKTMEFSNIVGTMKVRGNQTAGWRKKAFRIKFGEKQKVMGLNGGGKYKKWVLLADAKDTTLIRSAIGFHLAQEICKDEPQIWVSEFTPVTLYLNNEYWGLYYLAEQKEVKSGGSGSKRVRLEEPDSTYTGVDIGYSFELDYYADGRNNEGNERAKGVDGDPTFRMNYSPSMAQGRPSGPLASGQINTYTMLSDITDGPADKHCEADYTNVNSSNGQLSNNSTKTSNSNQLSFIRDRMEKIYTVLYNAAINNSAKEINEQGQIVSSSKSVEEVVDQYFDVASWVDGYILNGISVPPDLGYSSFYMSYDNTEEGDHKLRYDVPWDFDSNFGNRKNFYVNAEGDTYVDNTYNTWLYLFSRLSFFLGRVRTKWNSLRENQVFEGTFRLMRNYFRDYDLEIQRNHYRWPENDAASMEYNNFDEIRSPFDDPAKYKEAETETINWLAKRINYLERSDKWGSGRSNVNTNPDRI